MKLVAIIRPRKRKAEDRVVGFVTDESGPVPPLVTPENEDEQKDTEPPKEQ